MENVGADIVKQALQNLKKEAQTKEFENNAKKVAKSETKNIAKNKYKNSQLKSKVDNAKQKATNKLKETAKNGVNKIKGVVDKAASKAMERKVVDKAVDSVANKAAEKVASKAVEKTAEKAAEKAAMAVPVAGKVVVAKKGLDAAKGVTKAATKNIDKVANVKDLIKNAEKKLSLDGMAKSAKEQVVNKAKSAVQNEER